MISDKKNFIQCFGLAFLIGTAILIGLFWRSFQSDLVLFANDGSFGMNTHPALEAWSGIKGAWFDFYWLGLNGGQFTFGLGEIFRAVIGSLQSTKWSTPFALFILYGAGCIYGRALRLNQLAIILGVAVLLNGTLFSLGCWGLVGPIYLFAYLLLGLAALFKNINWFSLIFLGLCLGLGINQVPDVGAFFSLYIAAYVFYLSWLTRNKGKVATIGLGMLRVGVVALFAALASWQTVQTMVSLQIKGIVGTSQDTQSKSQRWDFATQWSLPKAETVRLLVPGFFGYRMDTPEGGNYWGEVGRSPGYEQHKQGFARYNGGGDYPGLLVLIGAVWALSASIRRRKFNEDDRGFSDGERKVIWFWGGAAFLSLLLAWGRYAPFYQWVYQLPYFSTIRNPIKFLQPFALSLIILFSYGLLYWQRRYFQPVEDLDNAKKKKTVYNLQQIKWWIKKQAEPFEKKWVLVSQILIGVAFLSLILVVGSRGDIASYLKTNDFGEVADFIVAHVITEMWFFLGFLVITLGVLITIWAGWWRGSRIKWGWMILTVILVADLGRANWPWIQYYNYKERYASNPVIDKLKEHPPYYGRVSILARQLPLYNEWHQHHFLYYNIQCLEFAQLPRMPEDFAAYMGALQSNPLRLWELTNTRYFLAGANTTVELNQQLDPQYKRFQTALQFGLTQDEEGSYGMAVGTGDLALIEFPNVLPRAQLYRAWRVVDDAKALALLPDPTFDIFHEVLVSTDSPLTLGEVGINDASGDEVNYVSYTPKKIVLRSKNVDACLLLVNDKYDPNWKVTVNGKLTQLLRCNYIMRGVQVPAGENEIVMEFKPPLKGFWISVIALVSWAGLGLLLILKKDKFD